MSLLSSSNRFALKVSRRCAPSPDSTTLLVCAVSGAESEWHQHDSSNRPLLPLKWRSNFKTVKSLGNKYTRPLSLKPRITLLARADSNITYRPRLLGRVLTIVFWTALVILYRTVLRNCSSRLVGLGYLNHATASDRKSNPRTSHVRRRNGSHKPRHSLRFPRTAVFLLS